MNQYSKMSSISIADCIKLAERYDLPLDSTNVYIRSNMLNSETLTLLHKNIRVSRTFDTGTRTVIDESISVQYINVEKTRERYEGC